ncbi:MAG TPA: hypothetical protein VMT18_08275, partial [Planctomycetota bacterium]|nr:hypothetical protein [Planctomycetota bacterium]
MKSPIATLALALLAAACSATGTTGGSLALTTVSSGAVTDAAVAREGVVRTQAGWQALWSRLDGDTSAAPSVDFTREMVVFATRPGGAVAIERVVDEGGFLCVELREGA